jgi:hypothetical protein
VTLPRKLVGFDEETWHALNLLSRESMKSFQELADEAFRDLLQKYGRPTDFKAALRESAAAQGAFCTVVVVISHHQTSTGSGADQWGLLPVPISAPLFSTSANANSLAASTTAAFLWLPVEQELEGRL